MEWISVDDRLPKPFAPVFAIGHSDAGCDIPHAWGDIYLDAWFEGNGAWMEAVDEGNQLHGVTYWMNQPVPPNPDPSPAPETLRHRGYSGSIRISLGDGLIYGKIEGIDDLIAYESDTVTGVKAVFKATVDAYIETRASIGRSEPPA